jgi:hypothetical protein
MRNILLILIILVSFAKGQAQVIKPLLNNSRIWEVFQAKGGAPCTFISGGSYFLKGDSLVNGILYQKVVAYPVKSVQNNPFCPPYYIDTMQVNFFTLMREDLNEEKVYILQDELDQVYFDYALKSGDILNSPFSTQGGDLLLDSVGSVALMNGEQIKVWYFANGEYFLEGIGGSQGLGFPFLEGVGFWNEVTCVSENGFAIYGEECLGTSSLSEVKNDDFLIYPNPCNGNFVIQTSLRIQSISIFNSKGQLVDNFFENNEVWLSDGIMPGLYVILVEISGTKLMRKLVVLP